MNYNISAYIVYLALMVYIIYFVGKHFFRNGRLFILSLIPDSIALANQINKLLLVAYYLFNIGYAFLKLQTWEHVGSLSKLISSLSSNMGILVLILAVTHYFNMFCIYVLSESKIISSTHKSFQS